MKKIIVGLTGLGATAHDKFWELSPINEPRSNSNEPWFSSLVQSNTLRCSETCGSAVTNMSYSIHVALTALLTAPTTMLFWPWVLSDMVPYSTCNISYNTGRQVEFLTFLKSFFANLDMNKLFCYCRQHVKDRHCSWAIKQKRWSSLLSCES